MLKFKKLVQQGDCTVLLVFAVFCSGEGFEMPPPWLPQEGLPTAALWGKWGAGGKRSPRHPCSAAAAPSPRGQGQGRGHCFRD